jgi:uroporphyrinogen-III decarboxylase
MHMLREEKPLLHYIAERAYHAAVELTRAWAGLRVDAIYFQETLSAADFIAPADYDEFVFPTTKALTQECQKLGMKAILYLTGNSMPRLPRLMEMSLDGLGVEESRKNFVVDIAKVREQVGNDLCLFGNIDAYGILEIGSDDQLQAELERQWRGGANASGTAFAMSPGSPITPGTTRERVRDFIRRTRELKLQRLPSP